ncbi:helix-turn-helix domain-containing protein [Sphingomonas histidinilytica]|jgi:CRP/FNR family transcriptional regulator|uniref:Transcriptional regulator, Crp/Fnr family n=1 Tax=Rhizorhabdus histidinilytica TaxID=439228 RepID=A0A1T5ETT6_9SPHN|nr:helix-turn-helix domain-containing protein [Rhizorhabdus histidinilytica]MBO9376597.1 helix-turn-helix domain-containing protein [Rhizorhabdus histidinilytica]QEH76949.1 helix-turn-helix domain-containing protein [Sphingomonas sp. C8-2]SKB87373.1 transcriptional regulator, Crp/Fnr family [Rhizorhabdus histidinilytica]
MYRDAHVGETAVGGAALALPASCAACPVRDSAICCVLDRSGLAALSRFGRRITLPAGQTLLWEGEEAITVGNLLSGMLKLSTLTGDGREQIVGIVHPSDFIGRPFGRNSPHSVTALTDATLCVFGRTAFDRFAQEHAAIGQALLERTLIELDRARHWMLLLGRKSACERVASLIVEIADRADGGPTIDLPLSRQQMGDILGLTIETVSRSLTRLKRAGVIALPSLRRIAIRKPDELRAIAEG